MSFSLIVPAYNEEEHIGKTISQLIKIPWEEFPEIIVVDDGSDKKISDIVKIDKEKVRIIRHDKNLGYGAALKTGIKKAQYKNIVITDADGSYPNEQIPNLVERFEENDLDMLVGSRVGKKVAIPLIRRPAKWILNRLANFVAGERIPDLNSGLRIFRQEVARRFFNLLPDGFSFTTTLTLAMLINGYALDFFPINYYQRIGRSKIRPIRDTLNFVQLVLNMALYFAPRKVFLLISVILLGLAVVWALFSKFVLGQLADVSTIVIIMTAIQMAGVGLLAELIVHRTPNNYRKDDVK